MLEKWANHQNKTRTVLVSRQQTEDADDTYYTDDTDDTQDIDVTESYKKKYRKKRK